ncbi:MAG: acyltransferase, partial [Syntrophales bacterium LBB04]|nr:acyltransferase [Syntrophales bacterium LBB04]
MQGSSLKSKENTRPPAAMKLLAFDYLRAFIIILVVLHHSILAYAAFVKLNPENPVANVTVIVDNNRWAGFDLIAIFNDFYFMFLLFFISGLFVWGSLSRKGVRMYLRDRLIRLGIPFIVGVTLIMPMAYFPAQLQYGLIHGEHFDYLQFWLAIFKNGLPLSGPLWFVWVLLAFNIPIVLLHHYARDLGEKMALRTPFIFRSPLAFWVILVGVSFGAYSVMQYFFKDDQWIGIGPFNFQACRLLAYFLYFLAGTALGACGLDRTFFKPDAKLSRLLPVWLAAGLALYLVVRQSIPNSFLLLACSFCATMVLGLIAVFLRFIKQSNSIMDSLSENSYGIYIIHYVFVA